MKRVTFQITNMSIAGGAERVVAIWCNYLAKIGYDMEIVTENGYESFYPLEKSIKMGKLNYFSEIKFLPIIRLIIIYKFLKQRQKGEYVVFHKYIPTTSIYILRKLGLFKDLKLVYFAHGDVLDFINFYKSYQSKKIFAAYDKIICLKDAANTEHKIIDKKKITIIPNPVAISIDGVADMDSKTILTVGRLSYPKGYDMLIDAWQIATTQLDGWKLSIVGSGELEEELKKRASDKAVTDTLEFVPATKNVAEHYVNAGMFISSSRYEGQPMVVLEALEAGLPIVSFDIPANRNLVKDNGVLVECNNINKLAEEIVRLAKDKDLRKEMSKLSKAYSKEHNIENIASKWNEIIE